MAPLPRSRCAEPGRETRTITVVKGSPEWAFLAALRALEVLKADGALAATVTLHVDGSGALRIPHDVIAGMSPEVRARVPKLAGSYRYDFQEAKDLVIHQCQGFAYADWP